MKVCSDCRQCFGDSEVYCTEDSHPPLSQIRNGSPEIIPGYRAELFLASDIKGETFYAHNAAGARCLITLRAADEELSRQFLAEAELAASFCHPNVVDVYEAGRLETGEVFVVSEDVKGKTLRHLLAAERVPNLLTTVQVVRQTAEALYALHTSGLTHGAINPENIILATDAQNRLLIRINDIDLGCVVITSVISNKFHSDSALDSLRYFAPEQCSGGGTSAKADIYSLGVVLHEMLAGAPPFNASKAVALIEQHRNQPPPEVRIDDIDLRMLLTHTLMEALRKRPEMRQASANVFARQMRHMEQLATHTSVPPPALAMPLATPKHDAVISASARPVRPAESPLAAVMKTAHGENMQLAAAIVENDTVPVIEDETDLGARPRRSRLREIKRKLRSMAHTPEIPESSVDDLPEILYHPVMQDQEVSPKGARRSRLRKLKRKLRSMAPNTLEIPAVASPPIGETLAPAKAEMVEVQAVEVVETAPATAVLAGAIPKMIHWEQPEDDIPWEAEVLELLSQKPVTDIPFVNAEPQQSSSVPAYPSISVDLERLEVPPRFLPDEDLLVNTPQKVVFLPSLGGAAAIRETVDAEQSRAIFSSFYGQSSGGRRWRMVGGGIVMMGALAFIGRIAMREFRPADTQSKPPAPTTVQTVPPLSAQPVVDLPAMPTAVKTVINDPPQVSEVAQAKPLPTKNPQQPFAESPQNAVADNDPKTRTPNAALVGRNLPPMTSAFSTVVITYGNGKVTSTTETGRSSAERKPAAPPRKNSDPPRPRVVKDPN